MARRRAVVIAITAWVAGCGGEAGAPDPVGAWEVVEYLASACTTDQPTAGTLPTITVRAAPPGIVAELCLPDGCYRGLPMPVVTDDGWWGDEARGDLYEDGRVCQLTYRTYAARLEGRELVLELTAYVGGGGPQPCTEADARAQGTSMRCTTHERIYAVRASGE